MYARDDRFLPDLEADLERQIGKVGEERRGSFEGSQKGLPGLNERRAGELQSGRARDRGFWDDGSFDFDGHRGAAIFGHIDGSDCVCWSFVEEAAKLSVWPPACGEEAAGTITRVCLASSSIDGVRP